MDDQRKATGESHIVRDSGRYPLCGRGDVNTYAIFAENMRWIVGGKGRVGGIVPSGIATDDTTKWFFQDLTESQSLANFFSFVNEAKLFPGIDHHVNYALLTMSGTETKMHIADFVFGVYTTESLKEEGRHFSLSAADIALLNPNTRTCPIFRSKRDMELTKAIYQRVPVLIRESSPDVNPWNISFNRIFDMTNDSGLFRTYEQLTRAGWKLIGNIFIKGHERYFPLYQSKMVWHFDHRFGTYEGQTPAQERQGKLPEFNEEQHLNPAMYPLPHNWIHETDFNSAEFNKIKCFLAFRDITYTSMIRTAIFSIIPVLPCGNNLPIAISEGRSSLEMLLLSTSLSSFVFDFVARQKVGGLHMNFFILKQLPVLPPSTYAASCPWSPAQTLSDWIAPRALELTYTAWDLEAFAKDCGYDGPPFLWGEERRFLLRCELDAAYFHLYGIARDDVEYLMDTFRVWKEKEEKHLGEYRTKRVILAIYDDMLRASQSGRPEDAYSTRLEPGPADPAVAHEARVMSRVEWN